MGSPSSKRNIQEDEKSESQKDSKPRPFVLLIGANSDLRGIFKPFLNQIKILEIPHFSDPSQLNGENECPSLIFCGAPPPQTDLFAITQIWCPRFPGIPFFFVTHQYLVQTDPLDRCELIKSGFADIYILPIDQPLLLRKLENWLSEKNSNKKVYRPIKLIDVMPGTKFDFDIYLFLPANDRYVRFCEKNNTLPLEKVERLRKYQVGALFVEASSMKKFYEYTASRLKNLSTDASMSETERSERMQLAVRDLFSNFLVNSEKNAESNEHIISEGQEIIKTYLNIESKSNWFEKVLAISANHPDSYAHAGNVAAYSVLFCLGLGFKCVKDIAMAALLHDVGHSRVPEHILLNDPSQWTLPQAAIYKKHVNHTVDILREKKLQLPEAVINMILQHHERFDGTGYPNAISGKQLTTESQILSFADHFDNLTCLQPGKPQMSTKDAILKLHKETKGENTENPTGIDSNLLKKILALFPEPHTL